MGLVHTTHYLDFPSESWKIVSNNPTIFEALDDNLAAWTRERTAEDVTEILQTNGVAALPVMGAEDRLFNPHFIERGLYSDIEHPSLGTEPIYNIMWNLEQTPPSIRRHAPLLGEHNQQVFGGLLGMQKEDIARLEEEQVLW